MGPVFGAGFLTLALKILAYYLEPQLHLFEGFCVTVKIPTDLMGLQMPVYAAAATTVILIVVGAMTFSRAFVCVPLALALPEAFIIGNHLGFLQAEPLSRGGALFLAVGVLAGTLLLRDMGSLWRIRDGRLTLTVRMFMMMALYNAGIYAMYSLGGQWPSLTISLVCGVVASILFGVIWSDDEAAEVKAKEVAVRLESYAGLEKNNVSLHSQVATLTTNRDEWRAACEEARAKLKYDAATIAGLKGELAGWKEAAAAASRTSSMPPLPAPQASTAIAAE